MMGRVKKKQNIEIVEFYKDNEKLGNGFMH